MCKQKLKNMSTQNQKLSSQSFDEISSLTDHLNQQVKTPKLSLFDALQLIKPKESILIGSNDGENEISIESIEFPVQSFQEMTITGDVLVKGKFDSIPHIWESFFPTTGVVGICGASEAGKSTFTRQLSLAICNGDSHFLREKLTLKHESVIYISTEDEETSMSVLIKKQTVNRYKDGLNRFRAGLNIANVFSYLDKELTKQGADLVVIDVWSDLYGDSPNDFSKVRKDLNRYSDISKKFKTCICILHHNTKHSEGKDPSKTNLNGSQAIEAKLRTLLELRALNDGMKQLSIIKGNYISHEDKKKRLILSQSEDLNFNFIRQDDFNTAQSKIKNPKSGNQDVRKRAFELHRQKIYSQDEIVKILKGEFGEDKISKGTLNKMLKESDSGQSDSLQ